MLNLPTQFKYSFAPLMVVITCILLALSGDTVSELLAFNRTEIELNQWWRLVTGHFLHTNINHLLLNLAGLVLLWALHGQYYRVRGYISLLLLLCVCTSGLLFWSSPELQWYVGLSGVLHGFFVTGAYFDIRHGFKTGWLMLIGVWIKVLHEQFYGASADIAGLIEANVAIDAHLFGTATGSAVILYLWATTKTVVKNNK